VDDVGVKDEQTQSIEQLYEEMGERLWWALLAYSGSREIANDATAEAFVRALASSGSIEHPANWVWRVGFRIATKELRSARRHVSLADLPLPDDDDRAEVLELMAALNKLSRQQRAAAVLFYLDGRPANEIGAILGIRESTVGVHLHRARGRLRELLGDDDG
jgi:RNA polymerase sigma-70 factor, ECF subfamily